MSYLSSESESDNLNYITYTKREKSKLNNNYILSFTALFISFGAIGLSSISFNNYNNLKKEISNNHYNNDNNINSIKNMITAHPLCSSNYKECIDLMHITSKFAFSNGSKNSIINGDYKIGMIDSFIINPNNDINIFGPSYNKNSFINFSIPTIDNCEYYHLGTCIFKYNNKLMTYSYIYFDERLRSFDDFFSYGASGAGMGSAIGSGVGALAGPEAIPIGAAIGGGIGAIVGGVIGAFQ